jgi:hypothetical protein
MFDESKYVSLMHAQRLDRWTRAWFNEAVEAEFIRPPYHPDTATFKRLRDYFNAGPVTRRSRSSMLWPSALSDSMTTSPDSTRAC